MSFDDKFDYDPDIFGDDSDDYFNQLLLRRKQEYAKKHTRPTAKRNVGIDKDNIFNSVNYTRRPKNRKPGQAVKKNTSLTNAARVSNPSGKSRTQRRTATQRKGYNSRTSVYSRPSTRSARRSSSFIISIFCIILLVGLLCSIVINKIYTAENIFSDNENGNIIDNAIEERLITSEENKDRVTYFLIVGVDKSTKLTDCIWVLCFDNEAHKMNVLQIPRDTYVGNDSAFPFKINGVYENPKTVKWCEKCQRSVTDMEINNSHHIDCGTEITRKKESNINALIRCINNRLHLPIDHYVLFDFEGFESVVDAIGGVDIYLTEDLKVYPNKKEYVQLYAGNNHLDGALALKFMRNRQAYIEGDLGRVRAQRQIIHAMLDKVSDMSLLQILSVLKAAYGKFSTDMSLEQIRSFISPVKKCGSDSLTMFELPGESYWVKPNPSYYVCYINKTVEVINEYMLPYSDKITAEDINFPKPQ